MVLSTNIILDLNTGHVQTHQLTLDSNKIILAWKHSSLFHSTIGDEEDVVNKTYWTKTLQLILLQQI
jgi:hypothetical protein